MYFPMFDTVFEVRVRFRKEFYVPFLSMSEEYYYTIGVYCLV